MMEQRNTVNQLCFNVDQKKGGGINQSEPAFHLYF